MPFHDYSLGELRDLAEMTFVVAAAAEVGIFAALADGPSAEEELVHNLGLDPRALGMLIPVLTDLGLVWCRDGKVSLTPPAHRQLADPDSPEYVAGGLPHWLQNVAGWARLPEALRTGRPVRDPTVPRDEGSIARFMAGMAAAPSERVARTVELCLERHRGARTMLDLGGGPGHYARAFAARGLAVTLLDTPETLDHVETAYGLEAVPGLDLVRGDFLNDPLPSGPFDIVLLSNILHIYSPAENQALLQRVSEVTADGGLAVVAEFLRGRSERAARFALVMLLHTEGGNAYAESDFALWLGRSGFSQIAVSDLEPGRHLITAVKESL
jgi:SAM-dependent methyltransferase